MKHYHSIMTVIASCAIATLLGISTTAQTDESRKAGNVPIHFFGKVVDQDGLPIKDAKVTLEETVGHLKSPTSGYQTYDKIVLQTGENGMFVLNDTQGTLLEITSIQKADYELSKKADRFFAYNQGTAIFHPDPGNPVVFTMWKRRGNEPLIQSGWDHNVECDGTTNLFALSTGQANARGDLRIVCLRSPLKRIPREGKKFDYTFEISVLGGGIQPTRDEFTYLAPENGYQPSITISQQADDPDWHGRVKQEFYLKTAEGHYGRIGVDWYASQQNPTHLDWNCSINPSGSRNLER